jgi:glycosyltransferase involved in cell wall biosynthesis
MKARRRILVDLLSYTGSKGGTDVYTRKLYESVGKLSHEFEFLGLASIDAKPLDMNWFPGPVKYSQLSGNNKIAWAIGELYSVNKFAKQIKPDLIHCPANFAPLTSDFKVVLTLHDALYWSKPHLAPNQFLLHGVRFMQKFASRAAIAIITDSMSSADDIEKYLEVPRTKISPIYLGTELKGMDKGPNRIDNPYFLAGGNRFRHKNWENLLKAWSLINPENRPRLIITGGRSKDPLVKIVKEYSLSEYVALLDWVSDDELDNLFLNASAVIIPSFFEGFSLAVMQAMAAKKPLLASDIPVHLELAEHIAFFFDPDSPPSIAKAVVDFSQKSEDLEDRLVKGVGKAMDLSWEKCASNTLNVFNRV